MQLLLTLQPKKTLTVPFHYQYQLQSALYALLGEIGQSDFWHDNGFGSFSRFKGFCFSGLTGKYRIDRENKSLCFDNAVFLEVRSASFDFMDSFQRAIERRPFLQLFDTRLDVAAAALANRHLESGLVTVEAITPVVAHRTLEDGHTQYFSPEEDEFFIRVCVNAEKKYAAVTGKPPEKLLLRPCGTFKKTVTTYKGTYITGYTGRFALNTSLRMAEFLYNTGLGEKNSQGFGFVRLPERG